MYRILLTNFSLIIVGAIIIATFITSKTFTQLGIAVILYPIFAFIVYKVLQNTIWRPLSPQAVKVMAEEDIKEEKAGVANMDKRLFLKLLGATGLSFFLISIFGRRIETLLFGQNVGTQPLETTKTSAAAPPTDGYTISEIDDGVVGYYGFVNKEGAWFIMKRDTDSGSFRYAKGSSDLPKNWKNRENLKYDYFHNVFVY